MSPFTRIWFTFVFVVLSTSALAGSRPTLVVGVENLTYLPHYTVTNGEYQGYAREILDRFAAQEGVIFQYQPLPVSRLFQSLVDGRIDFKYPDSPEWNQSVKAQTTVHYSAPVAPYIDGVMVPPAAIGRPIDQFRRLGTVRGFTPWAWKRMIEQGEVALKENPSFTGLLRQTIVGRVDGAYINASVANYFLSQELAAENALVFDQSLPHVRDNYFLSTAKHPKILARFNQWLLNEQNWILEAQRRWGIVEPQARR